MKKFKIIIPVLLGIAAAFSLTCSALATDAAENVPMDTNEGATVFCEELSNEYISVKDPNEYIPVTEPIFLLCEGVEEIPASMVEVVEVSEISPLATLSLSLSNLGSGYAVASSEIYYVENGDGNLSISTATWSPATSNLKIGWYNVDTSMFYYSIFSGGSVSNVGITAKDIPDGSYRICVQNAGTQSVTGIVLYTVQ